MALAGRLRAVAEDMAQMPPAIGAVHFGARIADLVIGAGAHGPLVDRLPETRPAGAAVILVRRGIKRIAAARAGEGAFALFLVERVAESTLRPGLAQDVVLVARKEAAPFGLGLGDAEALRLGGRGAAGGDQRQNRADPGGGKHGAAVGSRQAHRIFLPWCLAGIYARDTGEVSADQNVVISTSSLRKPWTKFARTRSTSPATCTRIRRLCSSSSSTRSWSSARRAPTQRWMP